MPEEPASSARLRHIGRTLRKIREDEGKTLSAVRRRLDRSPASLSAIENGLQPLRPRDLKYILEEYGMDDVGLIGAFQVLDIGVPGILSVVFVDHLTGRWIIEDEAEICRYREKFERVQAAALSETDSRELIHRIVSGL